MSGKTTHTVNPDAPDAELEAQRAAGGFPWCDTCKRPAVFSEFHGYLHSTREHRFGVPGEASDHDVTCREWWQTPAWAEDAR